MRNLKIAIIFIAVALFVGCMTAHAVDFSAGVNAYQRGDYASAFRIMRDLAEQGHAKAQFHLGVMYHKGQGVTRDYWEALMWFRKAAGQGVPQDYKKSVKWNRKGANQSKALAQANPGLKYEEGQGVTQDYLLAHMWYNIAAVQGHKDAGKSRDDLAKKMTPAQIAEAQKLARYWKPIGK